MSLSFQTAARWSTRLARAITPSIHIGVQGFYGAGNIGDEVVLAETIRVIRKLGLRPLVHAWEPAAVRSSMGVRAVGAHGPRRSQYAAMSQSKAFLFGGGGLIKDFGSSPQSAIGWMRGLELAQSLQIPTMTWSVGVDALRFPASARVVRETLSRADVITVRDPESAQRLRDLGLSREIVVTADPAIAYAAQHRGPAPSNDRPHIVVALRHWYVFEKQTADSEAFDAALSALALALSEMVRRRQARVTFIPLQAVPGNDDREIGAKVAAQMDVDEGFVVTSSPTVESTIAQLKTADVVIGMRLHASILATSLGVPTVALSYAPKVTSYMNQIGHPEYCHALTNLKTEWLEERVEHALATRSHLRSGLLSATDTLVKRFGENKRLLHTLIS